jgi:hypothetical protein
MQQEKLPLRKIGPWRSALGKLKVKSEELKI